MKYGLTSLLIFIPIFISAQVITTIAGIGTFGYSGDGMPAVNSKLYQPSEICVDGIGNILIDDAYNNRIRKVDISGIITTIAGNGFSGYSGDGGPAISAVLSNDIGKIIFDASGNFYIADGNNHRIRRVDHATGIITTYAGNGMPVFAGDNGQAINASLNYPGHIVMDAIGNLYISDVNNYRIRKVDASGIITTLAGNGIQGYNGDGGLADTAEFNSLQGIVCDAVGNVYIADYPRVRKINAITHIVSTVAGNGGYTYLGDGLQATATGLSPEGLAIDNAGNLFIADYHENKVFKVDVNGIITTVAGNGQSGYSGDGGAALNAELYSPYDVFVDNCNNVYIADADNQRIRKVWLTNGISAYPAASLCTGQQATLSAFPQPGCTGATYQWYINGNPYSTDSFFTYTPTDGDSISCVFTCGGNSYTTCNTIKMQVHGYVTPSISITASPGNSICVGDSVTFTATAINGGPNPTFQWKKNALNLGTGNPFGYYPANNDPIKCIMTSSEQCAAVATVTSNVITITTVPPLTPTINITVSPNDTLCAGTQATFTATITNGGSNPAYQWIMNGGNAGTNTGSYSYNPNNNDSVRCVLTSSYGCPVPDTVSSNEIVMTVLNTVTPTASITVSPNDTLCAGIPASFSATITNGGNTPTYQWQLNGNNTGTNTNSYNYTPNNNDYIRLLLTADTVCATTDTVGSNVITITVDTFIVPTITLSGPNVVNPGNTVNITATVTNAGNSYSIDWYNRGILFNTTTVPTVSYTKGNQIDTITAIIHPTSQGCYDTAISNQKLVYPSEGVENVTAEDISVYPNPATGYIVITGAAIRTVSINNVLGQQVYNGAFNNTIKETVNIFSLPAGVYFVRVNNCRIDKVVKK